MERGFRGNEDELKHEEGLGEQSTRERQWNSGSDVGVITKTSSVVVILPVLVCRVVRCINEDNPGKHNFANFRWTRWN